MKWFKPRETPQFLLFVYRGFTHHDGLEVAKSLTYTSLFAVVPLVTLVFAILSAFPSFQVFGAQIQGMIFDRLLPSSSSDLAQYLTTFAAQARNLTWVGAVMLLATAYLMLTNVERSFNRIWGVGEHRKGLGSFLLYWSVLSLGPLLLGVGFAISSYLASLSLFESFSEVSDFIGARSVLLGLFPVVLTTGAFTLLYAAVPNCGVQIRHAVTGAAAVALTFVVVKWVFTRFIASASYEFVYGTFAAIPIFLMWLYVCWVVILLGANLVWAIPLYSATTQTDCVHPSLLLLALLHKFWQKQQHGASLHVQELMAAQWPFRTLSVDELLGLLTAQKLIRSLSHDEYILTRDLENVRIWDVLSAAPWAMPGAKDLEAEVPPIVAAQLPDLEGLRERFLRVAELSNSEFDASLGAEFRDHQARSGG